MQNLALEQHIGLLGNAQEMVLGIVVPNRNVLHQTIQLIVLKQPHRQSLDAKRNL
jgi:hypothetical protein